MEPAQTNGSPATAVGAPAKITPTADQWEAINLALACVNDGSPRLGMPVASGACIVGFAGSGKSYALSEIARLIGDGAPGSVTVLAPTGKAALRLRAEGVSSAKTIHRWIYRPTENPKTGKVEFTFNPAEEPYRGVVLIDEGSMVGSDMVNDIQRALDLRRARAVVVGDGFQLPPVGGNKDDSLLRRWEATQPTKRLTEILRQAAGSPVIQASLLVRNGQVAEALKLLPDVAPSRLDYALPRMVEKGGAIVVHRNETRQVVNRMVRSAFGKSAGRGSSEPIAGEPLLVLQNTYTVDAYNGELVEFLGWIEEPHTGGVMVEDRITKKSAEIRFGCARVRVRDNAPAAVVLALEPLFASPAFTDFHPGSISRAAESWAREYVDRDHWVAVEVEDRESGEVYETYEPPPYLPSHFGYAYTCHKMQGSQAPNVLVLLESSVRARTVEGQRWLYTAVTRARKNAAVSCVPHGWSAGR